MHEIMNDRYAIGVDIGGTKINFGILDRQGHILLDHNLPTLANERKVMERVIYGIRSILDEFMKKFPHREIKGIGIGSAGQIDFSTGTVISATDLLPDYAGTPIKQILEKEFSLPVFVDNDVNVLALSEKCLGSGKNTKNMLCLALGTGVGGGIVAEGTILRGVSGAAGELGHVSVNFRGPKCNCGNRGCLELYASGTGIARMMRERLHEHNASSPMDEAIDAMNSKQIISLWLQGDPLASEVMDEAITALATAIAGFIHTFNPERIIIGGGVADVGEPLFERLREQVKDRTITAMFERVKIEPASLGSDSGMIGAAMQVFEYS